MKVQITETKDEKLLFRVSYKGNVSFTGATPTRADLKKAIITAIKAKDENLVVLGKITNDYGHTKISFEAKVYTDAEKLKKIEPKYLLKKNNLLEEKKEEEKTE